MPYRLVWEDDEVDARAAKGGRMTYAEAARQFGRSVTWVHSRIASKVLRTCNFAGRTYVDADSVAHVLRIEGYGESLNEQVERLMRTRPWEAEALLARAQAEANAEMAAFGMAPSTPSPEAAKPPWDPGGSLIRKYGE